MLFIFRRCSRLGIAVASLCLLLSLHLEAQQEAPPGSRTVMDAHNCYPYFEWWSDRIDRALSVGTPVAIEQDLAWYTNPQTGKSWSVVTHGLPLTGSEPTMEQYFFERVRPIIELALLKDNRRDWPLITLNLDFKDNKPEHLAAVRQLLLKYRAWISEAPRTANNSKVEPLQIKPILVLTGEADAQQAVFHDQLPEGAPLLAFGAVHSENKDPRAAADVIDAESATNYRRWWNNPWSVIEPEGQPHAGEWTQEKAARLRAFVEHAHANGLWIRFYTLDGADESELSTHGWFHGYNFGTLSAARQRWRAAIAARADYIASDQYELLGQDIKATLQ